MTTEEIIGQWILTTAIEFPRRLGHIFPVVEGEALNMKKVPGIRSEEYAKGLLALFDAGLIRFSSKESAHDLETRAGISKILARLVSLKEDAPAARTVGFLTKASPEAAPQIARDPALNVTFELTALGGEAWEKLAEPDWAHFFDQEGNETCELSSPDLTLIMARMGWFAELEGRQIQIETIKLEDFNHYQILYWKRLPHVYRATFACVQSEPRWIDGRNEEPKWFGKWWHATTTWYKHPWELKGWPSH